MKETEIATIFDQKLSLLVSQHEDEIKELKKQEKFVLPPQAKEEDLYKYDQLRRYNSLPLERSAFEDDDD